VLNIPQEDFRLRTEVTHYLAECGLTSHDLLTFRDQVDLATLRGEGRLALTLVDHNVQREEDAELEDCVVEIVDHHKRTRPDSPR